MGPGSQGTLSQWQPLKKEPILVHFWNHLGSLPLPFLLAPSPLQLEAVEMIVGSEENKSHATSLLLLPPSSFSSSSSFLLLLLLFLLLLLLLLPPPPSTSLLLPPSSSSFLLLLLLLLPPPSSSSSLLLLLLLLLLLPHYCHAYLSLPTYLPACLPTCLLLYWIETTHVKSRVLSKTKSGREGGGTTTRSGLGHEVKAGRGSREREAPNGPFSSLHS